MTPFSTVYDKFLTKVTDDMYMELTPEDTQKILKELLIDAVPWFEFPRKPLDYNEETNSFSADLNKEEVNILATYMVCEWFGRQIACVENTRQKYSGSDFKFSSQANHLKTLLTSQKEYERKGFHLQRLYKRRKKDSNGVFRSTLHTIMDTPVFPFARGNEDPETQSEGYYYDE